MSPVLVGAKARWYTGRCFVKTFLACHLRSPRRQAIDPSGRKRAQCSKEVQFLEASIETASQGSH
jgi:hypothetical protein